MEDRLPKLEKKLYVFEANDLTEPSRMVAQFVSKCVKCIAQGRETPPRTNEVTCTHHLYISWLDIICFWDGQQERKMPLPTWQRDIRDASEAFQISHFVTFTILEIRRIPTV